MRAARKISAASGSMAHNNMLTELVAWRSALPNAENFVQPWATRRAPRSIEIRVNGAARVIQGKWRRRNLMREVDSGKDARKLLKRVDSLRNLETRRRSSTFDPAALGMSPCPSTPCSVRRERTDGAPFPSRSASAASAVSSTTSGRWGGGNAAVSAGGGSAAGGSAGGSATMPDVSEATGAVDAAATELLDAPAPKLEIAKEHASRRLARQREGEPNPGELYPLYCDLSTFDHFGTDVSQYMHFLSFMSRLFLLLFLLNVSNIVINAEGEQIAGKLNYVFTWSTLGNTSPDALGGHTYAIIEVATSLLLVIGLYYVRGHMEDIRDRIRGGANRRLTAADFSLMVSHVPENWTSEQVRIKFEKFGEVVHVGHSLDYRQLVLQMKKTQRLKDDHTDALLALSRCMKADLEQQRLGRTAVVVAGKRTVKARAYAKKTIAAVEENDHHIKALMKCRYHCTGYSFVTFDKLEDATAALEHYRENRIQKVAHVFGGGLQVQRAPEPSDIIWENLQFGPKEQLFRSVVAGIIIAVLCLLGTAILVYTLGIQTHLILGEVKNFGDFLWQWLVTTLLIIIGHVIVIAVVPLLANLLERPHTHGDKEQIIMLKVSFFQWFNNVICAISFAYIGTKANPSCIEQGYEWFVCPEKMGMFVSGWYPTGAHLILNALIGDLIIINFVMDCFRPPEFIQKYVIAKRARTQARMNELRSVPADITLAFRVQMMNKFVTLGLMFSFGIPILYVILGVYGWLSAWIDRFNFLRQLRPPPETHDRQMAWVVNKIFPFAILLHLWMAVIFYRDVCLEQIGALGPASGTEVDVLAELRNSSALGAQVTCDVGHELAPGATSIVCVAGVNGSEAEGGVCHVQSEGIELACGVDSSAWWIITANAAVWTLAIIYYLVTSTEYSRERRAASKKARRRGSREGAGLSWFNFFRRPHNLFRVVFQRDVRHLKRDELPRNAHIRPLLFNEKDNRRTPFRFAADRQHRFGFAGSGPLPPGASPKESALNRLAATAATDDSDGSPGEPGGGSGRERAGSMVVREDASGRGGLDGPASERVTAMTPREGEPSAMTALSAMTCRGTNLSSADSTSDSALSEQLDPETPMFVPPLTSTLMLACGKDAQNRMLHNFLNQNVPETKELSPRPRNRRGSLDMLRSLCASRLGNIGGTFSAATPRGGESVAGALIENLTAAEHALTEVVAVARAHSPVSGDDDGEGEEGEEGGDDAVEGESSVGARSVLEDLEAEATLRSSLREEQELEALAEASARLCEVADQARRQLESRRRSTLPVSQRQASGVSFKSGASALSVNSQRSNRLSTASAESK